MAYLNKLAYSLLNLNAPTGLWEKIIMAFNSSIASYASAIIVLTLVIKIVLLPLDYLNRRVSRKQMAAQSRLAPEMEGLKKKYGNDRNLLNQKTAELYKKNNVNMGGSCIIMLVNLVLTLVIFFTLFAGLNNMGAYKIKDQYSQLRLEYYDVETEEQITDSVIEGIDETDANNRVLAKYEEVKESWLWVKNVWVAESPFTSSIPTYSSFSGVAKLTEEEKANAFSETEYEKIMGDLRETKNETNGYLIIVIFVVALSVVQQLIANKSFIKKPKVEGAPKQKQNWLMLVLLPLLMGYFAFQYNAVFALYIATSSLFAVLTTPIINTILDVVDKKQLKKLEEKNTISYSRKIK